MTRPIPRVINSVALELVLWIVSSLCALFVTSSFYSFYQICLGSSAGGAAALSMLAMLLAVSGILLWHLVGLCMPDKTTARLALYLLAWPIVWLVLMLSQFPIATQSNYGGCPDWLISTRQVTASGSVLEGPLGIAKFKSIAREVWRRES